MACNKAGAERGADREAKGVMDAKRIAEIRWGGEFHAKVNPEFRCGVAASDLIALCDLAAEAVAMKQAMNGVQSETPAWHAFEWLRKRAAEILATNENGKG